MKETDSAGQLLTTRQTGELLQVSEDKVRLLIETLELAAVRIGPRSLRIRKDDLLAFIEQRTTPRAEA